MPKDLNQFAKLTENKTAGPIQEVIQCQRCGRKTYKMAGKCSGCGKPFMANRCSEFPNHGTNKNGFCKRFAFCPKRDSSRCIAIG